MINSNRIILPVPIFNKLFSTAPPEFVNRNPRNLERLRLARKPEGYHLDAPGRRFWHKLELISSNRTVTAQVVHFLNGPIIHANTSEWALRKQLYSINDTSAYINLGRVIAQRCLESGLAEMFCAIEPAKGTKVEKFLREVVKGGIILKEPFPYLKPQPFFKKRAEKPWEVFED